MGFRNSVNNSNSNIVQLDDNDSKNFDNVQKQPENETSINVDHQMDIDKPLVDINESVDGNVITGKNSFIDCKQPLMGDQQPVDDNEPIVFTPPDGGYGWVVVISAFVAQIWIVGFLKSYSVVYLGIINAYPESSAYHISWIQSMIATLGLIIAPIVGSMCKRYTTRKVTALGAIICFVGLLASAFATSVTQLIFSMGVLTGVGSGLITTPGVLIVHLYFDKRRTLASAICVSGNSIGAFIMNPLIQYLLIEYKLRGTLMIVAALQLHIVAAACLYRPSKDHALVQARQRKKNKLILLSNENKNISNAEAYKDIKENSEKCNQIMKQKQSDGRKFKSYYKRNIDEEEVISREVSMYRCLPLTSSVSSFKDFTLSSINASMPQISSPGKTTSPNKFDLARKGESATDLLRYGLKLPLNEIKRNLSVGESIYCNSSEPNVNIKDALFKVDEEKSLRKQAALRRFVVGKTSSIDNKPIRQLSNLSLKPNDTVLKPKITFTLGDISDDERSLGSRERLNINEKDKTHNSDTQNYNVDTNEKIIRTKCSAFCTALRNIFDPAVLKKPYMIILCISACLVAIGAPHATFYLHAHYGSVNVESTVVTELLTVTSLVDLAGRLTIGYVADLRIIPLGVLYFFCVILAGVCTICVPLVSSYTAIAVILSGYGFGIGGWVVLVPTMIARNLGTENLPAGFGFVRMLMGIMNFISPQITGALVDCTGSFVVAYYLMGSCIILAAFVQKTGLTSNRKQMLEKQESAD